LEDIKPKAGRFFVIPKSHKIDMKRHGVANNVATHHDSYILSVLEEVKAKGIAPHAPALRKGSILLWNSKTVHGSLDTQDPSNARSSITVHAIPNCDRFLQQQTRIIDTPTTKINETYVYSPKDQVKFKYRLIKSVEANFPSSFYMLKRWAIVFVMFINQRKKS
jgi:phytanoyl-CoA hydroxylase